MNTEVAIGVDLGGTSIKTGLVSSTGTILYQNKYPAFAEKGRSDVLNQIEASIRDAARHAGNGSIRGIGIGSPGVVDENGVVKAPPNFADFDNIPLQDEIRRIFNLPTKVENDANAAAIAESKFGAGKSFPDFLFVIWGTGVGGGIILNRNIYRGPWGGAGEIGHISIDYKGPQCNCGSIGCVEAHIGQKYLSQRTAERLQNRPDSMILKLIGGNLEKLEPVYISQAAQKGDELAREILVEAGTLLGVALGAVMNTMDLRVSIIGGGVAAAGDFVMDAIKKSVQQHVLKPLRPDIQVIPAKLGNNAGILGAAGLVL
ncbi:MAG: ROK family protein [Ignavibacteriales bacterium]|nr:ROK family protein [Ignavibacteriales bacterium]